MKILLYFLLIIFLCEVSFAQEVYTERRQPSQFNKFIELPSIDYAMQSFDSIRFQKVNLNALLRKRVLNKEIKASLQIANGNYGNIVYSQISELFIQGFGSHYDHDDLPFDTLGNTIPIVPKPPGYFNKKYIKDTFELLYADEIIYVEKGKLNVHIPYVSPVKPVITTTGIYIGYSYYFTSSFNFKHNNKGDNKDKSIWLGTSVKSIVLDSINKTDVLKQLYGRNLLESIWEDLKKHKIYYITGSKEQLVNELNFEQAENEKTQIPVYDPNGALSGSIISGTRKLNHSDFTKMNISLDWKYNVTRNIVLCEVKNILLFGGSDTSPLFRIVY